MPRTQDELLRILEGGELEQLVGEFENEWLECKSQPYRLDKDAQKLELAKDVSALANADGGIILLGFSTKTSTTHGEDQVDSVRPFPLDLLDADQYRKLLASWLWPPVENVEVRVFASPSDGTRGVAAIIIPPAATPDRPILVQTTVLDTLRRVEIVFGYCERKQGRVTHLDVQRLHGLLRDGRRLDDEIRAGFDSIQAALASLQAAPQPPTTPASIDERVQSALRVVGLENEPAFTLVSAPPHSLDLRGLFESRTHPLVQLLEDPPELRNTGFDLGSGNDSRIIGRVRRVFINRYKLLEIHRDGLIVFVGRADRDGLCWGRAQMQRDRYLVNQLALVERTYLFCLLASKVYGDSVVVGERVHLRLGVSRLSYGDRTFYLEPGPIDRYGGLDAQEAPSDSVSTETEVSYDEPPERWAVILLAELYALFGYEEDHIPYTRATEVGRAIDAQEIAAIR